MNVILDSNVLFSALIKDSLTRKLILEHDGFFLFPEFIFTELERHKEELLRKMKISEEEARMLLRLLLNKVLIVPNEKLAPYRKEALDLVKDIDIDDVLFIACALANKPSIIWSDDKKLKKQTKVIVLNTTEMKEKRSGRS